MSYPVYTVHSWLLGEEVDSGGDTQPSAAIRSMWDSVVSWMKMAVDFIATEEAVPAATPSPSTRRKVGWCSGWWAYTCNCMAGLTQESFVKNRLLKVEATMYMYIIFGFLFRNVHSPRCLQMFLQWRCPDFSLRGREKGRRGQGKDACAGICSRGKEKEECPLVPLGQFEKMMANLGKCVPWGGWNSVGMTSSYRWWWLPILNDEVYTRATLICRSSLSG